MMRTKKICLNCKHFTHFASGYDGWCDVKDDKKEVYSRCKQFEKGQDNET